MTGCNTAVLPRMRTVAEIKAFFADNGERALSDRELRRLAKSGTIPCIMAGSKMLINLDALINYLSTNTINTSATAPGAIRRID